ncbi:MAG TPA: LptE family protein [Candidatus Acidoferrales bacterium]|nr:LptE family protein [Candidatus Acidoferrales bacterium]
MRWRSPRFFCRLGIAALALAGAACGYHVAGRQSALPKSWRTVAVPVFVNRTLRYRLEQRFTQAVVRELEARTTYRIIPDPSAADAVLRGEMTSIEAVPVLFDSTTGRATMMLVTVQLKVQFEDRATKKLIYKNDQFVFRDEYELTTDPRSFFEEEDPALGRMARDFASTLVSGILENF